MDHTLFAAALHCGGVTSQLCESLSKSLNGKGGNDAGAGISLTCTQLVGRIDALLLQDVELSVEIWSKASLKKASEVLCKRGVPTSEVIYGPTSYMMKKLGQNAAPALSYKSLLHESLLYRKAYRSYDVLVLSTVVLYRCGTSTVQVRT